MLMHKLVFSRCGLGFEAPADCWRIPPEMTSVLFDNPFGVKLGARALLQLIQDISTRR